MKTYGSVLGMLKYEAPVSFGSGIIWYISVCPILIVKFYLDFTV